MDLSQEHPDQPRSMLAVAISAIRDGDLSQTQVARLSDLSRNNARVLAAAWESIPEENRIDLVRRFDELSEERVDLNFGRALRVALNDRSAVVRQLAVAGLWEDESSELLDRLRDILQNDESPDVRAQAAAALERFSSKAVVGSLDESVASDLRDSLRRSAIDAGAPYAVQRRALESLGPYAADPEISSLISEAFNSEDHGLQCSALYAMGRSQDARWLPTILVQLESEDPEIRFEAARAAGLLGSADALTVLLQAARDEDAEVRHVAIGAISQIGGRGAVRALERLAEDAGEADLELIQSAIDDVNTLIEPLQPASS
ncbi:MAG TPA: HEAT repeat domain-containing protein [Thermomicrobiales bacterium]|nr:HEAT repeat domain-containing protein [Thermomicrobiales bacterium]